MLRATIKPRRTSAYVALLALLMIYIVLFTAVMYSQELPGKSRGWLKQELHQRKAEAPARFSKPDLGSADWFRERGHCKLALFMPLLEHIDWDISYDKPGKNHHTSRNK